MIRSRCNGIRTVTMALLLNALVLVDVGAFSICQQRIRSKPCFYHSPNPARKTATELQMSSSFKHNGVDALKWIASAAAASFLAFQSSIPPAEATPTITTTSLPTATTMLSSSFYSAAATSSTIQLADEIKTFDMSLPSYDSLSSTKANAENVGGLEKVSATAAKEVKQKSAPTTNFGSPDPEKATREAQEKGEKSARAAQERAEKDATKAAAEAAKAQAKATKAAEKAAKAAADAKKKEEVIEEQKGSNLKIVDMDMPSYGGGSDSGKKKSVFSL